MTGVWTETISQATCPVCTSEGKPDSRLYHYAVAEGTLSILQQRCHFCRHVKTIVNSVTPEALRIARKVHLRGKQFAAIAVWTIAFVILAFAAGSTYAAP